MKCNEAEKYIYLSTEVTLDNKTREELEEHIRVCELCAAEFAKSEKYFSFVKDLRNVEPQMENGYSVSEQIISRIELKKKNNGLFIFESFLDSLYKPVIRYSAALLLFIICLVYFSEEFYTVKTISEMEERYNRISEHQFNRTKSAAVEPGFFNSAKDMYGIIKGDKGSLELPGGWMLVKKSELIEILKEYNKYAGQNISGKNEDLKLKRLLSNEDYRLLMEKRNEINELINRYLPGGEK